MRSALLASWLLIGDAKVNQETEDLNRFEKCAQRALKNSGVNNDSEKFPLVEVEGNFIINRKFFSFPFAGNGVLKWDLEEDLIVAQVFQACSEPGTTRGNQLKIGYEILLSNLITAVMIPRGRMVRMGRLHPQRQIGFQVQMEDCTSSRFVALNESPQFRLLSKRGKDEIRSIPAFITKDIFNEFLVAQKDNQGI